MMRKSILFLLLVLAGLRGASNETMIDPAMIMVEGGDFKMGGSNGLKNELPVHIVRLKSFYIAKYEVTQGLWERVMTENPSANKGCSECPVEGISFEKIQLFLARLEQLTGKHYRLPTEAEWEYAALGGGKSKGYKYSGGDSLGEVAWFEDNANKTTHPVGQKKPNELGIYDMSGNVWEMCSDWYDPAYYKKSALADPRNDKKSAHKVVRGGSWRSPKERCYSKARNRDIADHHKQNGGFRLVLDM